MTTIHCGDCLSVMLTLPENSVDFMGKKERK